MKVSIIVPIYNGAQYVTSILDNIRAQTMTQRDIETILFLDGGHDKTADIISEYINNYPNMNIRVIDNRNNSGVSIARNKSVSMAKGEYIHFCDVDDIFNTDFYAALYDSAHRTGADVAVSSFENERFNNDRVIFTKENVFITGQDKLNATRVDLHGYSWRYLIRRDFWLENNFQFPTDMKYCEDMLVMNKMVFASNFIVTVPGAIYTYKFRPNSALTNKHDVARRNSDYHRALADVKAFLLEHNLKPNKPKYHKCRWMLFGGIPFMTTRTSPCKTRTHFKLFGILPILSLRRK